MLWKTTLGKIAWVLALAGLSGCPDSETEEPAPASPPAMVELDSEPTKIPAEAIRPSKPADPLPRLIATIKARGGKVSVDDTGITAIDWQHAKINNLDLELLTELPTLKRLYLAGTRIDYRGWVYLSSLPNLERLALWRTPITDEDLKYLAGSKNLKVLDLSHTRIRGAGLVHLENCEKLETLILKHSACSRAFPEIARLKSLRVLDLWGVAIRPERIEVLKSLPRLEELRIYLYPEALPYLAKLPHLRTVKLTQSGFPHPMRSLESLRQMKSLEIIEAEGDGVRDAFFEQVSQCQKLRELRLRAAAKFTDKGLAHLIDCKTLRLLDVRDTKATPEGLRQIAKANSEVRILVHPITLYGLADAFRSMGLGAKHSRDGGPRLRLDREMDITAIRLEDAKIFPPSLKLIAQAIDPEKLEHLGLGDTNVTDLDLANFRVGPNLKHLNLAETKITTAGLKALGGGTYPELPYLETLDLTGTTLDEECLAWIATLESLKTLRLMGVTGVTEKGWAMLEELPNLETLEK